MTSAVLQVEKLSKSFGGIHAVRDLSFDVDRDQILGLIGPNGSGKSTTVNTLSGVLSVSSGKILLGDTQLQQLPEYKRAALGLTRTFQTTRTFTEFTVREHVELARNVSLNSRPLASLFHFGRQAREAEEATEKVNEVLELTGLRPVAERKVATISVAQQRFLMIATALASGPKIVLLDEPAAGLVSHERKTLSELIRAIRNRGTAVLVIEHHMEMIMDICDQIVVLNFGTKIAEGTPHEIRNSQAVIDAYLGEVV